MYSKKTGIRKLKAIGLIETLSTVLIISFGVVGLAILQIQNTVYLNNNISTLKASFYAEDLAQKLLGNVSMARSNPSPYVLPDYTNIPKIILTGPVCIKSSCSSTQLANYDMNVWLYKIQQNFPDGKAKITKTDNNANSIYTIEIQWKSKSEIKNYKMVYQI